MTLFVPSMQYNKNWKTWNFLHSWQFELILLLGQNGTVQECRYWIPVSVNLQSLFRCSILELFFVHFLSFGSWLMTAMIFCFYVFLYVVAHGSVKIMLLSSMQILKYGLFDSMAGQRPSWFLPFLFF